MSTEKDELFAAPQWRLVLLLPMRLKWRSHSAHVGQEVEVHYRWHALHGRRVRRQSVGRRVAHVEMAPGVVLVVAAGMLDPVACAAMAFGAPRVMILAPAELHQPLIERDFRRNSPKDPTVVQD